MTTIILFYIKITSRKISENFRKRYGGCVGGCGVTDLFLPVTERSITLIGIHSFRWYLLLLPFPSIVAGKLNCYDNKMFHDLSYFDFVNKY